MGTSVTIAFIVALALLVSWLGGGRKWAFRTILSLLVLGLLGSSGIVLYAYWTNKSAERRAQRLHECAIAKIATARCEEHPPWAICPPYELPDNPTSEQENAALAAAEDSCKAEMGRPAEQTLHEQVSEYRRQHGIKETATAQPQGDIFDQLVKECAGKVRKKYPNAYHDLDDATLVKKVLAKYPKYCEPNSGDPPGWEPVIEGIR